jgi:phosphatidate cytidylyltransferase
MALNIQTFGVRSVTALVFVAVLAAGILWNYLSFSILFLFISMAALKEYFGLTEKLQIHPYRITGYICGLFIYFLFSHRNFLPALPGSGNIGITLLTIPFIIFAVAIFSKRENPLLNAVYTISALFYAVIPFALLHLLVLQENQAGTPEYAPEKLIAVILLIWCNDTFAYIGGSLYGKHKLIERISPGKTVEGTFTGIALSFAAAFFLRDYLLHGQGWLWPVMGIIVPVLATIGDLTESMMKRQAGVKDSGRLMPGHGGILDRFDSLIFVSPFVVVILELL